MATLDVLTLSEAKLALNLTGTGAHDVELAGFITASSLRLDELVGPVVRRQISAETHDGGAGQVFVRFFPVSLVASVTEYSGTTATVLTAETPGTQPADAYLTEPYSADVTLKGPALHRRSSGADARFPVGRGNVVITYTAGRAVDTAAVDQRFKLAASLILINLWRSQQDSSGGMGEFDIPNQIFPRFAVPNAVRELMHGEVQEPDLLIG
ncbi:hypothetical protein NLX83_39535 [Allokutzneria sp. A3M-2-11 16]|uniref:hypothetical protein n=1 Tax=Allokutzneria sp. A3M-2-11 16 TaxID=2962043 RepID=UPI0020B8DE20|nr:hypothetical protein [Allokutzneria sp. A3M-2-11 16]MCP3805377.1 hypothetical protein [Allokutzneria sp. A3M-2-11 16]